MINLHADNLIKPLKDLLKQVDFTILSDYDTGWIRGIIFTISGIADSHRAYLREEEYSTINKLFDEIELNILHEGNIPEEDEENDDEKI